jgi:hypothetical protein
MGDQIRFHEAWFGLVPIVEGAKRDRCLEQRPRSDCGDPMALLFAVGSQHPVTGSRAD